MNGFPKKITNLREYNLEHNQLAQICGSKQLFRDRYQILRILGRGGFGITFLAKNAILPGNPLCVIKQLSPKVTNPKTWPSICRRFEKEAKILAQLGSHSQIPLLVDYFQGNGEFYLVQEYIKGNTLSQEVRQNGLKSEAAVKQFLQELLLILQYIHQNRVIHRDIKPQNILRCEDDRRLVLIDFGAVKEKLADASENSLNKPISTNFVGTIGFAPPEQISLRPVYASDIYAVGVTCLYLLTGKAPSEFAHDIHTGEICWQQEVDVSDSFAGILAKMLKISLQERFKTVEDVIKALGTQNYSPSLSNCLATQPLTSNSQTQIETQNIYVPPSARTAIAIRARKAKLQGK